VAKGKHIPPFLLLHVAEHPDTTAQARRFAAVLRAAGIPVTVVGARETTHNQLNDNLGKPDDPATAALWTFVRGVVK
jgi:arylformamidase